ncbi:MAG TPA: GtrA family protein [Candidatus Saccharimonadales bacterium]|nr:GtrA family protein [Candidatus Saccharimonadales bacterium]
MKKRLSKAFKKVNTTLNKYESLRQFIIYVLIGSFASLSDLFILFFLVEYLHVHYLVAAAVSFTTLALVTFYLHKNFTFKHKGKSNKLRFLIFVIIGLSGLFWNIFLLFIFVEKFQLYYLFAAVLIKFIVLVWNFTLNKFVTFRILKEKEEISEFVT